MIVIRPDEMSRTCGEPFFSLCRKRGATWFKYEKRSWKMSCLLLMPTIGSPSMVDTGYLDCDKWVLRFSFVLQVKHYIPVFSTKYFHVLQFWLKRHRRVLQSKRLVPLPYRARSWSTNVTWSPVSVPIGLNFSIKSRLFPSAIPFAHHNVWSSNHSRKQEVRATLIP